MEVGIIDETDVVKMTKKNVMYVVMEGSLPMLTEIEPNLVGIVAYPTKKDAKKHLSNLRFRRGCPVAFYSFNHIKRVEF